MMSDENDHPKQISCKDPSKSCPTCCLGLGASGAGGSVGVGTAPRVSAPGGSPESMASVKVEGQRGVACWFWTELQV